MKSRIFKRTAIVSIIAIFVAAVFSNTYFGRYVRWNLPDVYDLNKFPSEKVENGNNKLIIPKQHNELIDKLTFNFKGSKYSLNELIDSTTTRAFLILHNDTIIYENYTNGNTEATLFKAFSATKSVLSTLIGIAIDEGKIKSIDEPIKNYVTGFEDQGAENLTIKQCLMETTGIEFNTSYLPWSDKPKAYYKPNIRKYTKTVKVIPEKQNICSNSEHNTNLLGMVLENAINQKTTDYLSEKIWKPAGMNHPASFSVDSKRNKFACVSHGLNATAMDFLLFGKLFLNNGFINGNQIVSQKWIKESTTSEYSVKTQDYYKNYNCLWWIMQSGDYFANGHFGQRIYISPRSNTVIVRLGEKNGGIAWEFDVFPEIVKILELKK